MKPELLVHRIFWTSLSSEPSDEDWKLLKIGGLVGQLLFGFLNARMFEELRELVSKQPSFFSPILVREMGRLDSGIQLATFAALRNHRLELMAAMSSVDPVSIQVVDSFARDIFFQQYPEPSPLEWQALLAVLPENGTAPSPFLSYVLFLTATRADLRNAKELYAYSFQALHDWLSKSHERELDEFRSRVLHDFSSVSYGNEWDLCGRIRGALARHFVSARVADEHFLRCAKDIRTLTALVRSMADMSKGKSWLRLLLKTNSKGNIRLTDDEVSVVKAVTATSRWFF